MSDIHPPATHLNGGNGDGAQVAVNSPKTFGSKRQRRPSVRLGDLGGADGLFDHPRRTVINNNSKQWKVNQSISSENKKESNKGSKTRTLTNLSTSDDENNSNKEDTVAIGSWRVNNSNKDSKKRVTSNVNSAKRVRSNWVSKIDENGNGNNLDGEEKCSGGGDDDLDADGYGGEFDVDNSEREQSPSQSLENLGDGNERSERDVYYNRSGIRTRERDSLHGGGVESSGPSDTGDREYMNNGRCSGGEEDGVKIWLNSIGLGRYAPIFEIHEVDDEVLPMLTLEDLKDMGINAVGSRRKMFCAIQKLGKGFS